MSVSCRTITSRLLGNSTSLDTVLEHMLQETLVVESLAWCGSQVELLFHCNRYLVPLLSFFKLDITDPTAPGQKVIGVLKGLG